MREAGNACIGRAGSQGPGRARARRQAIPAEQGVDRGVVSAEDPFEVPRDVLDLRGAPDPARYWSARLECLTENGGARGRAGAGHAASLAPGALGGRRTINRMTGCPGALARHHCCNGKSW
jgi:hypothetical protein